MARDRAGIPATISGLLHRGAARRESNHNSGYFQIWFLRKTGRPKPDQAKKTPEQYWLSEGGCPPQDAIRGIPVGIVT